MTRVLLTFARFDYAICQYFVERTGSDLWRKKRALALDDVSKFEQLEILGAING